MIAQCEKCGAQYEDVYRWTFCPHDTFPANDGQNNFAHHPEAHLLPHFHDVIAPDQPYTGGEIIPFRR